MIIESVVIKNFRSITELSVDLDSLTVLLGANSAGKSSVIKALEWFFGEIDITQEDVRDQDTTLAVSVFVTFSGFTAGDREAFPSYTVGTRMPLLKTRAADGSTKLTGRGLVYPPFRSIREQSGAKELSAGYRALRQSEPALDLPDARTKDAVLDAMSEWERQRPEDCEEDTTDATHLLGAVGGGVLRQRFKFVLVPAMRDASEDAREGKGSALTRLLLAIAEQRSAANERMAEFEAEVRERYEALVVEAHGATLDELSGALTTQMKTLVSTGEVRLEARPGNLGFPGPQVVVQAGESDSLTDLARQGHGFQRAFVISALQYLSESGPDLDAPTIFLAVEEPELYQHPVRARHFASVLDRLAERDLARVQVLYATHSPCFVNARKFESIRVLRRPAERNGKLLSPVVSQARIADVAEHLAGVVEEAHIRRRLTRTIDLNPSFGEAFFADAVLLVEGNTDATVIRAVATAGSVSLDERGIAICTATKTALPVALCVLRLLGIPTYVVFDGDRDCKDEQRESEQRINLALQSLSGVETPTPFPTTEVHATLAVFEHNLDHYLCEEIADFHAKCQAESVGADWRAKSAETYASVVAASDQAPAILRDIVAAACRLPGAAAERLISESVEQLTMELEL